MTSRRPERNRYPYSWFNMVDTELEMFKRWALEERLFPSQAEMVRQAVRNTPEFKLWKGEPGK